jgi:hypothetical protein
MAPAPILVPRCAAHCGHTSRSACSGCSCCQALASAHAWPTTWAWARRSRYSRYSCSNDAVPGVPDLHLACLSRRHLLPSAIRTPHSAVGGCAPSELRLHLAEQLERWRQYGDLLTLDELLLPPERVRSSPSPAHRQLWFRQRRPVPGSDRQRRTPHPSAG